MMGLNFTSSYVFSRHSHDARLEQDCEKLSIFIILQSLADAGVISCTIFRTSNQARGRSVQEGGGDEDQLVLCPE